MAGEYLTPTPYANPLTGLSNDMIQGLLEYMKDKQRTQQMQGLAGLLESTGIPKTVERAAYADSPKALLDALTNVNRANVPLLKAETADAIMNVAPFVGPAAKGAERAAMAAGRAGERYAEKVVPQIMERGGLPAQLLGDLSQGSVRQVVPDASLLGQSKAAFTYPQEEAMRLAQQRAALPISEGGLGLKPNNTAAERAKAMGFDIESLHGTSNPNIERFDPSLVGSKAGNPFDNYMWSTTNPDAATGYSLNMESYKSLPEIVKLTEQKNDILKQISKAFQEKDSEKVGDLRKKLNSINDEQLKIFDTFKQGEILSEGSTIYPLSLQRQEFMPYEASGKNWMKANRPAIEQSQDLGYQGVQINNVIDNPNSFMGNEPATTFATENPDLLRSRFAAFDPWRRTSAIAAAMGVAAPDLLAEEQKPKKKKSLLD